MAYIRACSSAALIRPADLTGVSRESSAKVGKGRVIKGGNIFNLLLLKAAQAGRSAQWRGDFAPQHWELPLHSSGCYCIRFHKQSGSQRGKWPCRRYRTYHPRKWEETYSSAGVYWFFNCWAPLTDERVLGLKWDKQQTSKIRNFWLCILPSL